MTEVFIVWGNNPAGLCAGGPSVRPDCSRAPISAQGNSSHPLKLSGVVPEARSDSGTMRLTESRIYRRSGAAAGYAPNSFLIRFLSMNLRLMYVPTPHELFLFHYECCSHSDMCFSQNFTAYSVHPSASVPMPSPKP
jgi:hypothetical protein